MIQRNLFAVLLAGQTLIMASGMLAPGLRAADLPEARPERPRPVRVVPAPVFKGAVTQQRDEMKGIWAAIAYSPREGRHGIFWGADKKEEAETIALKHCRRSGGEACAVVAVFRNHRHWDDDDGTGFPYHPCGVLAVGKSSRGAWAVVTARAGDDAQEQALRQCSRSGEQCEAKERVCT